jgi:serine/threonine-protein kinase
MPSADDQPTLDSASDGVPAPRSGTHPKVELVTGSRPMLSAETRDLLRIRLRVGTSLLLLATVFFVIRGFLGYDLRPESAGGVGVLYRTVIFITLSACAAVLWSSLRLSMGELRAIEAAVFGIPCLVFIALHLRMFERVSQPVHADQVRYAVQVCSMMWFAMALIYGTFIPNTLRRAAIVIGLICLAPLVLLSFAGWKYPQFGEAIGLYDTLAVVAVTMGVAFTTSVYGSYKIGALRREAFEARLLGQYRLTERLGQGGMGEVYLAEHQLMKRPCAIKLIRPSQSANAKALKRFEREVRTIARLTHWNSVEIFDYGRAEDGTFYYAMEYLPGLTLQEMVERQGPVQPARAIHLLRQVCDALSEAHALGLVHRDIKPSNVIASRRGGVFDVAKLLDFGLAASMEDADEVHLTQEGTVAGSPLYMAPERFLERDDPDARADIYSLGAVLYFLLTGQPPFRGEKPVKVMLAHAHEPVIPPSDVHPGLPRGLDEIILCAMAKEPGKRYQRICDLAVALDGVGCGRWTQDMARTWWVERSSLPTQDTATQTVMPTVA